MDFHLKRGQACRIRIAPGETEAVRIAAENLRRDLELAVGCRAELTEGMLENTGMPEILVGTAGNLAEGDSDFGGLRGADGRLPKEAGCIQVRDGRLVLAGADRRGTVYAIYELCERIGVSPWYFWADVPVKTREELCLPEGTVWADFPSVEYRGIFINDEEELDRWVKKHMGEDTIGVRTYEKIFELLLRLKANYIWPAMHVNSFNLKRENGALADRMGIVVGTSHCDMLMRSNNREWKPWIEKKGYPDAKYDYSIPGRNREILKEYWRESLEQNREFEVCYTLGMRGIHDSGFETEELAGKSEAEKKQAKVELLETIIRDQRELLRDTLPEKPLMTFIPYKEVLELYDAGLSVPEDMTLVWANDNYGYIRRYPSEAEKKRSGGNGVYYHNSYWAPPSMSYVFLCSIPLAHTRHELEKAYAEGIRKLWVINTGAMKPLEQEIEFFLRLAWEAGRQDGLTRDVDAYAADWIDRNFSGGIGERTARLLNDFSQLTNVRKLENMDSDAFFQDAYGDEAAGRIHKYEELFAAGNELYAALPEAEKDAFYQLVLMRIHAGYFTNLSWYWADRSRICFDRGWMQAAGRYTSLSRQADGLRRKMLVYYNKRMAGGKWDGILDPEGFPPPRAANQPLCTPPLRIGRRRMLVHIWQGKESLRFERPGTKWIEIGNGGEGSFEFMIQAPEWAELSETQGTVTEEKRILISVQETEGEKQGELVIRNLTDGGERRICLEILPAAQEQDGLLCLEAESMATLSPDDTPCPGEGQPDRPGGEDAAVSDFRRIRRLGRSRGDLAEARIDRKTGEGVPVIWRFCLEEDCRGILEIHRFPSLNSTGRIRIGVSVDGEAPAEVESSSNDEWRGTWKDNVLHNDDRLFLQLPALAAGEHTLRLYAIDRYFAFSRLVLYTGERRENELAGLSGCQALPKESGLEQWAEEFYGPVPLAPRPVMYSRTSGSGDSLETFGELRVSGPAARPVEASWYLEKRDEPFAETDGGIRIDLACALSQSYSAFLESRQEAIWRHCAGEGYCRIGLDLYVPAKARILEEQPPALHYRFTCGKGSYTVWLLARLGTMEQSFYGIGLDGKRIPESALSDGGCLWRYETEQIYRWVAVLCTELEKGEHELILYGRSTGLRFSRAYITAGGELPPLEQDWCLG
ncbi:MAG: glycosyl hydrolase 115 family protein [Eubacteriales bacterium]|nr:glycosyl hydrolase 115 family protein [Eubacteriales bacterium]